MVFMLGLPVHGCLRAFTKKALQISVCFTQENYSSLTSELQNHLSETNCWARLPGFLIEQLRLGPENGHFPSSHAVGRLLVWRSH